MTIHFRGKCRMAKNIRCYTTCRSKWNNSQPMLVMEGCATKVSRLKNGDLVIWNTNE